MESYNPTPEEYEQIMKDYAEHSTANDGVCPFTQQPCIDENGYCQDGDCLASK